MRPGLLLSGLGDHDAVDVAVRAEALGYDSVWLPELWGEAAPVTATAIAENTDDLVVGSAIMNVFSRSPAVLAMTAVTLAERSGDRFVLGVGTSTRKAVEDLHGMSFDRPVRRAHETIELVREFTRGEGPVDYDGELFSVADFPSLEHEVPIYGAALGPANRRVVGRLCDGWMPHNVPFPELDETFETIEETAREAGRDPGEIEVAPYVPVAVSDDEAEARDAIRGHVAYYVGSGEGYERAVASSFPEAAERVATAWREGDRDSAREAVTDEVVDALGVAGTPDTAPDALERLVEETPITRPIVVVPSSAPELAEGTITALAPEG
jgi:alkanesulfonate monooxygenase SsuD/methylene tetrahydromethanopterin reductase-like flavin-dependent oxidoreductase (luciferase family)